MFLDKKNSVKGFTLLELMVTVVIAGILLSIAVPNFTPAIESNRMSAHINQLSATFNYARSEALKRTANISVCGKSNAGSSCTGNWNSGWTVFIDINKDGNLDAGETILRVNEDGVSGNTVIHFTGVITYAGNGVKVSVSPQIITICDSRGEGSKRGIIITAIGQVRSVDHTEPTLVGC